MPFFSPVTVDPAVIPDLLRARALRMAFQPIVNPATGAVHGFEALMRSPEAGPVASPEELLGAARLCGASLALECLACELAVEHFTRLDLPGVLFINVSASTIIALAEHDGGGLLQRAALDGLSPERICLELTEHERVTDVGALAVAFETLRARGLKFALDDFGDGRSSLRLWVEMRPEIVKIDRFFAHGAGDDRRKLDAMRHMVRLASALSTMLVVEGIETEADLAIARELGGPLLQGYLFGRPSFQPARELPPAVLEQLLAGPVPPLPSSGDRRRSRDTVESLVVCADAVRSADACETVLRHFARHEALHALAVVDGDRPVGLINRRVFQDKMSQPFHIDLFGRRPCSLFMDPDPLRVDRHSSIDSLATVMLGENQRYLTDGFIVTDNGRYLGLGTGEQLVRAVTERRIEAARLANPLTCLPGNVPITDHIRRLLAAQAPFAAAYFDLNDFKPYNDLYGYWRGDEMIKLASAVLVRHCDSRSDFLGHVGGDDFVVLFQSADWDMRCRRILDEFARRARDLFDPAELARGGFVSEDRRGFEAFFPLTSMSVGVVPVVPGCVATAESVASSAALAKKAAKRSKDHFFAAEALDGRGSGRLEHAAVA